MAGDSPGHVAWVLTQTQIPGQHPNMARAELGPTGAPVVPSSLRSLASFTAGDADVGWRCRSLERMGAP